jgi:hypothetical protein
LRCEVVVVWPGGGGERRRSLGRARRKTQTMTTADDTKP